MIEIGDYVAQQHPNQKFFLKKGIVIESLKESYTIHWLTYNRKWWMDDLNDEFKDLNQRYILSKVSYHRQNDHADIIILNKAN